MRRHVHSYSSSIRNAPTGPVAVTFSDVGHQRKVTAWHFRICSRKPGVLGISDSVKRTPGKRERKPIWCKPRFVDQEEVCWCKRAHVCKSALWNKTCLCNGNRSIHWQRANYKTYYYYLYLCSWVTSVSWIKKIQRIKPKYIHLFLHE